MTIKTKILIVDDYDINITSLKELIDFDNVEIYSATTADKALELLMEHDFALALLDVQMPDVNGFELAEMIKSVKKLKQLPIIFVTAQNQDNKTIFDAYKSGAVDLLFKPLNPEVVRSKVSIFVELSEQRQKLKKQVKELNILKKKAEAAAVAKGRFLANMSHEIRTPLSAVLGYSELIDQNPENYEEVKEYCSVIARNGKLLRSLIDSIFDLSKMDANKFELGRESFSMDEVLEDIQSSLSFQADQKNIDFSISTSGVNNTSFIGDPTRLKQIFINIIGNAIKFTPEGKVEVNVVLEKEEGNKTQSMKMTVSDEGIGISEEQARNLFEAFSQADATNQRKFGGAGLGLAISKEIARSMGGDISLLRSVEGEGTIFLIEVKLVEDIKVKDKNVQEKKSAQLTPDLSNKSILCVDDSKDNLRLLQLILKQTGAHVEMAAGGLEGIELAKTKDFDVVLMDIQMPIIDGFQTTRKLRDMGFNKPIFAVTAHVMTEEHQKCIEAGCNTVVKKPITQNELFKKLRVHL